jgi:thiosulfate/3-mercaptopyruvate sulfurtransferase
MRSPTLVSSAELEQHRCDPLWVILDCRFDLANPGAGRAAYDAGHVPGAFFADLDKDLARPPAAGDGRHPLPNADHFRQRVAQWGITPDTQVVVYDGAAGGFAARAWWMLRWIGHDHVALLNGGLAAWQASGGALSAEEPPSRQGVAPFSADLERSAWVVDVAQIDGALSAGVALLDARGAERFEGHVEPIDPVAGHIPGAVNYPFSISIGPDGLFRSPDVIRQQLQERLSHHDSQQPPIAMCGSGVTACHLLLSMEIAGLASGRLYAGSWSEWVADPARPVATGPAQPGRPR